MESKAIWIIQIIKTGEICDNPIYKSIQFVLLESF